jgi:hypothetical protein
VTTAFNPETGLPRGWEDPSVTVAAPWTEPTVRTAREFCELPDPATPVLLGAPNRPLLRYGDRLVIGAGTGAGKTTMCMRIIRAIVLREKFLEWRGQLENARALVLDLEQGRRSIKRTLRDAGLDECEAVDYVEIPDGLSIDRHDMQQEWLYRLLHDGRYDVVMFDPLYKLHDADANDEQAMIRLMKMVDGWRTEFGFALLIPAHLRKADKTGRSKPTIDDIAGSGTIVRGAEVVLGLELMSGIAEGSDGIGKSRLHFWKDRDGDLPTGTSWMLSFKPTPSFGFVRDEEAGRTTKQRLVRKLAEAYPGEYTAEQLAKLLGVTKRTVQRAISEWVAEQGEENVPELGRRPGPHNRTVYYLVDVVEEDELAAYEGKAAAARDTVDDDGE